MTELREKVARELEAEFDRVVAERNGDPDFAHAADRILAIPEIAEALSHHRAAKDALDSFGEFTVSRKLGHSISTNPPR